MIFNVENIDVKSIRAVGARWELPSTGAHAYQNAGEEVGAAHETAVISACAKHKYGVPLSFWRRGYASAESHGGAQLSSKSFRQSLGYASAESHGGTKPNREEEA